MTVDLFQTIMTQCIDIMKTQIPIFGINVSLWDFFLWSIVMYALLKLFFTLFE